MRNFTIDNDFWFTVAEGKYVLKNGFPHTVPFTIYNNLEFIYQSWGTGVIFYLIHTSFLFLLKMNLLNQSIQAHYFLLTLYP